MVLHRSKQKRNVRLRHALSERDINRL